MRQYLQLNDFGIEVPDIPKKPSYYPIFGNDKDPMIDRQSIRSFQVHTHRPCRASPA